MSCPPPIPCGLAAGSLIIHGDNLLALKALLPTYGGKVKCIYIDPPYNTGNEKWAYNDKVNSPMMKEWLGKAVDRDDLTRHDKWLCMMTPRLQLLRDLLRDDGVIFVSIDDNEVAHLRLLMDEVFGEGNFLATIIWQKVYSPRMDTDGFSEYHDFILVYGKTESAKPNKIFFEQDKEQFKFYDELKTKYYRRRSLRKESKNSLREDAPNSYFSLTAPNGNIVYPIKPNGIEGCWRWSKETYEKELKDSNVEWVKDGKKWEVYAKQYYEGEAVMPPVTLWLHDEVGHNHEANDEIRSVLGTRIFESPKPVRLIKKIFQIGGDKNSIILDSFAGSGTAAHAALALNNEDGGNRKFILVECEDYADKITAERVRRVMKGYGKTKGMGGTFSFFELGKPIDAERILKAEDLPTYFEMARYIFYTATGGEFDERKVNEETCFIGESAEYKVHLLYKPDLEYLKTAALTLDFAQKIGVKPGSAKRAAGKKRLVFAPMKFLDREHLERFGIEFAQLPFEVYNKAK